MTDQPRPLPLPPAPFTRRAALTVVTKRDLAAADLRRVTRGVYAAADAPDDHGLRIRAALVALPADAVLFGRSAAWWHGVRTSDPGSRVEAALPADHHVRSRAEIHVRRVELAARERTVLDDVAVTTPARTAFDIGCRGEPAVTVPTIDALLRVTATSVGEVAAIRAAHPGARGCRRLDAALALADPAAESAPESRIRVLLVTAGLPRPVANFTIVVDGVFVARVDLAWPSLRVAVEYDGAHHDEPQQVALDRRRLNALRSVGWTVLVVDRHQMRRPDDVVHLVATVLRDAARARRGAA